jgi:uncharacterized protein (TIGR00369 family)
MADTPTSNAPFSDLLGTEIVSASDGTATVTLALRPNHSMRSDQTVAHGGVVFSLADAAGAHAVNSLGEAPSPTVDMRIDFLEAATSDLTATGTVDRTSQHLAFASITVTDEAGQTVAKADGIYKR